VLVIVEQVYLIEYKDDGYTVSFGRGQKAVNECGAGLWLGNGDNEQCLVNIGCQNVALLREVDAFADDVVLAILNLRNPAFVVNCDPVAYGHRIRRADSLDTEIALYLTIKELAIVRKNGVPASSILNNETFHSSLFTFH
jgi:hypothetical protein